MSSKKKIIKNQKSFVKGLHDLDIKHKNKIVWEKVDITPFIEYVDSIDIYLDITNTTKISIADYKSYKIIGYCKMNQNLAFVDDTNEMMYLITDDKDQKLFISIGRIHPVFWYKMINKDDFIKRFDQVYETYNQTGYHLNHKSKTRAFIGTDEMLSLETFDIENHLLMHKYSEKLLWGSKWNDHPYRSHFMSELVSPFDSLIYTGQAMQQDYREDTYKISVRTKYSKSIITIHYHEDTYIVEIRYDKIDSPHVDVINQAFGRYYNQDLPVDVILLLFNFPFVKYDNIISMTPFMYFHFYIINLLISDDRTSLKKIEPDLKKILENQPDMEENLKAEMKDLIIYINDMKIFEDIVEEVEKIKESNNEINLEELLKKYSCQDNDYIKKCIDYYLK